MAEKFGEYVRGLRKDRTRKEVAAAAGISAEYLRQIEEDDRIPKLDKLLGLATALGEDERSFLGRALTAMNPKAARLLLTQKARYPKAREELLARLKGPGVETVASACAGLSLAPQEHAALLTWTGVYLMDAEGLSPEEARRLAPDKLRQKDFVERILAEYLVRNLLSWQSDPDFGGQVHKTATPRTEEMLRRFVEHAAAGRASVSHKALSLAEEFAELLELGEFEALFDTMVGFKKLSPQDRADIKNLWDLSGRLVKERLARSGQD